MLRNIQKRSAAQHERDSKKFSSIAGTIFLIITVLHLARIVYGWQAEIGGWDVPTWLSWVAVVVAGSLAYHGLRLGKS